MKKFFLIVLSVYSASAFAQTGFFIQPEIGAGVSNSTLQLFPTYFSHNHDIPFQNEIFSGQVQVKAGYENKRWEITAGIGYLRTGYNITNNRPDLIEISPSPYIWGQTAETHTIYDPHITLPVSLGYKVHISHKLLFVPTVGAVAAYNLNRSLKGGDPSLNGKETLGNFNTYCNRYSLIGMAQLNFEYTLNSKMVLTIGPSIQYMLTSETTDYPYEFEPGNFQYDFAVLMNFGVKYCFNKKHLTKPIN